jgi:hypothetical protein
MLLFEGALYSKVTYCYDVVFARAKLIYRKVVVVVSVSLFLAFMLAWMAGRPRELKTC